MQYGNNKQVQNVFFIKVDQSKIHAYLFVTRLSLDNLVKIDRFFRTIKSIVAHYQKQINEIEKCQIQVSHIENTVDRLI